MNKSITIIADGFPSKGKPFFVFVQQLVVALVDLGVNVSVIAPQSLTHALLRREALLPRINHEETANGNKFIVYRPYCISFGNGKRLLYKIANVFNSSQITKALKRANPDILYGHFWHNAYKVRLYATRNHIPLFVACGEGDNALEDLMANMSDKQKKSLVDAVYGVICVSSENKRKTLIYNLAQEDNIAVLPNCVDDSIFFPQQDIEFRRSLGIDDDDFAIVFTGSFIHRKGSKILSDAIRQLNDSHIKVIFMGKPLKGDNCTPNCPGIVYMASTEHNDIPNYLNAADIFVLPTLKEGCSNAIVEALACGLPVISSNRPFNMDILNNKNSILVNPESVEEVASAISQLKNDKELYASFKKYTHAHSKDFSIVERAKKIITFIEEQL